MLILTVDYEFDFTITCPDEFPTPFFLFALNFFDEKKIKPHRFLHVLPEKCDLFVEEHYVSECLYLFVNCQYVLIYIIFSHEIYCKSYWHSIFNLSCNVSFSMKACGALNIRVFMINKQYL